MSCRIRCCGYLVVPHVVSRALASCHIWCCGCLVAPRVVTGIGVVPHSVLRLPPHATHGGAGIGVVLHLVLQPPWSRHAFVTGDWTAKEEVSRKKKAYRQRKSQHKGHSGAAHAATRGNTKGMVMRARRHGWCSGRRAQRCRTSGCKGTARWGHVSADMSCPRLPRVVAVVTVGKGTWWGGSCIHQQGE